MNTVIDKIDNLKDKYPILHFIAAIILFSIIGVAIVIGTGLFIVFAIVWCCFLSWWSPGSLVKTKGRIH